MNRTLHQVRLFICLFRILSVSVLTRCLFAPQRCQRFSGDRGSGVVFGHERCTQLMVVSPPLTFFTPSLNDVVLSCHAPSPFWVVQRFGGSGVGGLVTSPSPPTHTAFFLCRALHDFQLAQGRGYRYAGSEEARVVFFACDEDF
jgi:hypothetical protein